MSARERREEHTRQGRDGAPTARANQPRAGGDRLSAVLAAAGLGIMIVSEAATLSRIEPFYSWNTPICWTGFILFADAIVWRSRGRSWIRSSPRDFVALALVSIPLWVVFEGFNLRIRNWYYTGLPDNLVARYAGYAWAFATISPAIFEAAALMAVLRGTAQAPARFAAPPTRPAPPARPARAARPALPIFLGATMLVSPFVVSAHAATYMAAPVWLGFIFLLDPLNERAGGPSLFREWRNGEYDRSINLALAGLLCGALWEFWNYWAGAKWHYTVPIMPNMKIFEMPLPGYLGFPPFALECFTMYVSVRILHRSFTGARTTAEPASGIAL